MSAPNAPTTKRTTPAAPAVTAMARDRGRRGVPRAVRAPARVRPRRILGGFTMLEVLVAMAMVGILASIGYVSLPRDRFAAREVARVLAADINRARSEAVRLNTNVALRFGGSDCGDYCIFVDADKNGTADTDLTGFQLASATLQRRFLAGDFPRVTLTTSDFGASGTVWFDVRGLPRESNGAYMGSTATAIVRPKGADAGFQVTLEPQGRVQVASE